MAAAVAGMTAFGARAGAEEKASWAFDFGGPGKGTLVKPDAAYSQEAGFGFERSPEVKVVRGGGGGAEKVEHRNTFRWDGSYIFKQLNL